MDGMRLGGIDPSILRELSGVYKPFVKAFKELISNAFDADAESVRVDPRHLPVVRGVSEFDGRAVWTRA